MNRHGVEHRYGIEDEAWFEAARSGLESRGFRLHIQPRAITVEKPARLPRVVGSARQFLEFAERQGIPVDPAAFQVADLYGDERSDLRHRASASPFETPSGEPPARVPVAGLAPELAPELAHELAPEPAHDALAAEPRRPEVSAVELRLAELRAEQERLAVERREAGLLAAENRRLAQHCAALQAEIVRLTMAAAEAVRQRDLWQMSAASAEDRLRAMVAEADRPPGVPMNDGKFDQLRRFLARELHPDLAGDGTQRTLREALFKRIWAKIEQLQ